MKKMMMLAAAAVLCLNLSAQCPPKGTCCDSCDDRRECKCEKKDCRCEKKDGRCEKGCRCGKKGNKKCGKDCPNTKPCGKKKPCHKNGPKKHTPCCKK